MIKREAESSAKKAENCLKRLQVQRSSLKSQQALPKRSKMYSLQVLSLSSPIKTKENASNASAAAGKPGKASKKEGDYASPLQGCMEIHEESAD